MQFKKQITVGQAFGQLTTVRYIRHGKDFKWECLCVCGKNACATSSDLRRGHTQSCGCLHKKMLAERNSKNAKYKTGVTDSRTYSSWSAMRTRVLNNNHKFFKYYGGKGVTICARWNNFKNFLDDMGERPQGKTLDRINGAESYGPKNCRWATPKEQANNRSPRTHIPK